MKSMTARAFAAAGAMVLCCALATAQNVFETALVRGVPYIPMNTVRGAGLGCEWDPLLKNLTVTGAAGSARFHVGSEYVLDRGTLSKLSEKVRFVDGEVFLPVSAGPMLETLLEKGTAVQGAAAAPVMHAPRKIVIDAGHGGYDSGAIGLHRIEEKAIVLDIARTLASELEARGFEVVMTRDTDVFIPLERRAGIANQTRADLFVSVHGNASTTKALRGFEVYSLSEAADDESIATQRAEMSAPFFRTADSSPSSGLKTILWDLREAENRRESIRLAQDIAGAAGGESVAATQRLRSAQFYVLKWTECPAVLVETGYLTNAQDARLLRSPYYRKRMAKAIAQGLVDYRTKFERTEGFTK